TLGKQVYVLVTQIHLPPNFLHICVLWVCKKLQKRPCALFDKYYVLMHKSLYQKLKEKSTDKYGKINFLSALLLHYAKLALEKRFF
ncbi:MAG: hypothetical protein RR349_02895, partial [Oscillospiraceae bacterium]